MKHKSAYGLNLLNILPYQNLYNQQIKPNINEERDNLLFNNAKLVNDIDYSKIQDPWVNTLMPVANSLMSFGINTIQNGLMNLGTESSISSTSTTTNTPLKNTQSKIKVDSPTYNLNTSLLPTIQSIMAYGNNKNKTQTVFVPSDELIKFITQFEGFKPDVYTDSKGVKTIGHGLTNTDLLDKYKNGITEEQSYNEISKYLTQQELELEKIPNWRRLNKNQKNAIRSYAYNIGAYNLLRNSPKFISAAKKLDHKGMMKNLDYGMNDPNTRGLIARRKAEQNWFNTPGDKYQVSNNDYLSNVINQQTILVQDALRMKQKERKPYDFNQLFNQQNSFQEFINNLNGLDASIQTPLNLNVSQKSAYGFSGNINTEVENDEVAVLPNNKTILFKGNNHEQGGIDIQLPKNTDIYSKRISIDGVSLAQDKINRTKYANKVNKLFSKSNNDLLLKNTQERVSKYNQEQDKLALDIQSQIAQLIPSNSNILPKFNLNTKTQNLEMKLPKIIKK